MGSSQLAKQHRNQLPPAAKTTAVTFRFMPRNQGLELYSRDELEKLAENAAYSIQSGTSLFVRTFS
jgi:hypothetical protein